MKSKIMACLTVVVLVLALMVWLAPSTPESPVQTPTIASPASTMGSPESLPLCASEDGSGQALCYWDAGTMGNGIGTSVVSGDCAPDYVGSVMASTLCQELHAKDSYTYPYGDATITVPNGADLVGECNYEWTLMQMETGNDMQLVFDDGFSLIECYKAHLK